MNKSLIVLSIVGLLAGNVVAGVLPDAKTAKQVEVNKASQEVQQKIENAIQVAQANNKFRVVVHTDGYTWLEQRMALYNLEKQGYTTGFISAHIVNVSW